MLTDDKLLAERQQWSQFHKIGKKEMLTDKQASSWKKAKISNSTEWRKEMLTDEQASSWKKAMKSIQQAEETKYS